MAYFDGMSMEEIKRALGETCAHWGLEDFEDLRQEAKKQRRALEQVDNKAILESTSSYKDGTWIPQTGHADLRGRPTGVEIQKAIDWHCQGSFGPPGFRGVSAMPRRMIRERG